ncbi:acyl-CoA dehydrogenase NM domain-like protein [Epithele typhae]|uniref:acyl-CoA dehydrogenase NM domain-like protein n=1 Tax=Epithele typhae TaxID=378194 RepID=UPI002008D059|nr:acyl-CoA dehydrogenase NM domain-like protein [Epithele typhae]KAH9940412.1 acyl-CoA dehydrogenase NM domain-like protein [Epithele typhae]
MSSAGVPRRAHHLLKTDLFLRNTFYTDLNDRALVSYEKAKAIGLSFDMKIDDILHLTPKFWQLHNDPISLQDGAALTLLTIQYNLAAGTIARYAQHRPDLVPLVEDLLQFRKHGQYMLTEVGHGLDIGNIETTATLLPSGDFSLTSPTPSAAKFMPPTVPAGLPCIAVVFAKLIVDGEDRGHRPFLVALNDGKEMCTGVQARCVPFRDGTHPVYHSITTFTDVRLPRAALLGTLEKPGSMHENLMDIISRVSVGSIAVGCFALPILQCVATIGTLYSLRRHVGPSADPARRVPILSFRTQQAPLLAAVTNAYVVQAFQRWAIEHFCAASDPRLRRAIAVVFKVFAVLHAQESGLAVSDRCGAQGLFSHNAMVMMHSAMRGIAIAEGDILGLSIRLTTDILLGHVVFPPPSDPTHPLARHEASVLAALRATLAAHGPTAAAARLLPHCQPAVEAIGHRLAHDAAAGAPGGRAPLVDLFVAQCVARDAAWYAEHAGLPRDAQRARADAAHDAALPLLGELVAEMDVGEYVGAPIVSDARWAAFVEGMVVHEGEARVELFGEERGMVAVEEEQVKPLRAHL